MKSEIKALWIEALRSGKYLQGPESLKRVDDGIAVYCCLGVLCEIHSAANDLLWYGSSRKTYFGVSDFLPDAVMQWAELTDNDPVLRIKRNTAPASVHNDGSEYGVRSFLEIANAIEKQL